MKNMNLNIYKPIKRKEIETIAELHYNFMNGTLLQGFGIEFLADLYEAISECGAIYVCREKSEIVGFVAGVTDTVMIIKNLASKKLIRIMQHIIRGMITNPRVIMGVIQSVLYHTDDISAELVSIVVSKDHEGRGIGTKLVRRLITYFGNKKVGRFKVITDVGNVRANDFYRKLGFRHYKTLRLLDRTLNYYVEDTTGLYE